MPSDVTREEFEARVGVLEREVEGEKMVTRHVLEQTRRNGDDLAAIRVRVDRLEVKVDRLEVKVDGLDQKLGAVEQRLSTVEYRLGSVDQRLGSLERNLPQIIATTMREVLDERD